MPSLPPQRRQIAAFPAIFSGHQKKEPEKTLDALIQKINQKMHRVALENQIYSRIWPGFEHVDCSGLLFQEPTQKSTVSWGQHYEVPGQQQLYHQVCRNLGGTKHSFLSWERINKTETRTKIKTDDDNIHQNSWANVQTDMDIPSKWWKRGWMTGNQPGIMLTWMNTIL